MGRFGLGCIIRTWSRAYIRVRIWFSLVFIHDEDEEPGGTTMPPRELLIAIKTEPALSPAWQLDKSEAFER